jgi:hypothetical protein
MKTSLFRCFLGSLAIMVYLPCVVFSAGLVNSPTDAALRAAMAGGGTVTFNCEGTIAVTDTLAIASSTVVDATGHAITISGGNAVQLFSVNSGVTASFLNLTLANGRSVGSDGRGGSPSGGSFTDGQPGMGGAILNSGGTVALTSCTIVSNLAIGGSGYGTNVGIQNPFSAGGAGLGGAVYNRAGSLFVTNCNFAANGATGGVGGTNQAYGGAGGDACGGTICSQGGSVVVQNSTFVSGISQGGAPGGNSLVIISYHGGSGLGGAIWTSNATANCYNSTFSGNLAAGAGLPYQGADTAGSGKGGAIFATNGVLNCAGCTFTTNSVSAGFKVKNGNVGQAQGGAIWSQSTLTVSQSSFFGNQAAGQGTGNVGTGNDRAGEGSGGAIFNGKTFALFTSTFANNLARGGNGGLRQGSSCPGGQGRGGAIFNLGTLNATNCTLVANTATGGNAGPSASGGASGGDGAGGGLFNTNGTAVLVNLTFASNNAAGGAGDPFGVAGLSSGGAICNSNGTVRLYNTIVAYSTSGSNCSGTLTDAGHNLSSDTSGGLSLNNTDPLLGPLGDYGSPTLTVPLLAGSPAIDGGSTATAPANDQRGHARPYGAAADIGAFESSPPYFIGGLINGLAGAQANVTIGSSNVTTTSSGSYGLEGFTAGTYTVTPSLASFLFAPPSSLITVGPDQVNVNFNAYLPAGNPPTIITEPVSRTNVVGTMAAFAVTADGSAPLNYQWSFNGTNISGATNATLLLANVQTTQAGNYAVWVTNYYGSILSSNAVLTVNLLASCVPPPAGLMGWWRGEGDASDSAGGNTGSVTGVVSYLPGEVGEAFAFNGSGGISAPGSPGSSLDIATGSGITIECWLEPTSTTNQGPIVLWSTRFGGLQFWVEPGLQLFANLQDSSQQYPNDHMVFAPAGLLSTNSFQHVALTYDKTSGLAVIYLNGTPVVSTNMGSFSPQTGGPLYIGKLPRQPVDPDICYVGLMDELGVYNRALSQGEIQSINNAGSDGKCPIPIITGQPASQLTTVGSTVTLTVTAGSSTPLNYQWTFGGTNLVGATNASLTLTNIQLSQSGSYVVSVANAYGSALSSNAVLTVGFAPSITIQPTNQAVLVGGAANFSVTASGTAPLSYQWIWNIVGAVSGATNSSLTLTNLPVSTNSSYVWVQISNPFGSLMSSNVLLTVLLPPSITTQPTNQVAAVGSTVSFVVSVYGTLPCSYQWSLNGTNISGSTNATLLLSNVQSTNAGNYMVQVTNIVGSILSSNALLTVGASPSISVQPASRTNVAGTTATFSVTASGLAPLNCQWSLNGTNLVNATNDTLTLANVQWWQAGSYAVLVTNVLGSALSSNAVLTVQSPPYITAQPLNQVAAVGGTASFSVTAGGLAPLHYQWNFNGTNQANATNATLTLTNVQFNQAGNYAVLVTNSLGSILSSNAFLTVNPTGIVLVCDEADLQAAVAAGGTITFGCDGVITLTKTLAVTKPTTLDGTGHAVTISGGHAVQLFSVNSGVTAGFINLTLANGYAAGSNGVAGPPITAGQPGMGGAILNNGGTVALTGCLIVSNNAMGGAGSANPGTAPFTGTAGGSGQGGAICNLAGNLAVTNCNFAANGANGGAGGYGQNGGGAGGDACGGAIYSLGGNVAIQHSTFVLHTAQGGSPSHDGASFSATAGSALGGVLWSSNATVNFNNSTFISNSVAGAATSGSFGTGALGAGGVIFVQSGGGVVNCVGCTFTANTASTGYAFKSQALGSAQGGVICNYASLSVSQSSFLGNQAINGGGGYTGYPGGTSSGGAIFNGNMLSLSGSTFSKNAVVGGHGQGLIAGASPGGVGRGGAICSLGTLAATNCTLVANSATGGQAGTTLNYSTVGGNGTGGGLFNNGTATLVNLTFASNKAVGGAGSNWQPPPIGPGPNGSSLGGAIYTTNGTVSLYNTIVAYSTSGSNCWGTLLDSGYNLSSDPSAGFYAPGSLNNTDPVLGPLGNYGGATLTLPLLAGSPAIDGGNTATAPATDQRGHARPYGAAADIGAFESSPPYFVGGQVSGSTLRDEVTIVIGPFNLVTTNGGIYGASAIAAGSYSVTPTSPNYLFIPASRLVTVGPDQFGFNFKAYHWNALSLESSTNGVMHCIIADTNSLTVRVLTSTDLIQWLPVSTNTIGPSNYFETFLPITGEPMRYYRTVIP